MNEFLPDILRLYQQHIISTDKQPQAIILFAFLVTFVVVRLITRRIHNRHGKLLHDISVGGTHIHHLVLGILLLLLTGYLSIALDPTGWREGLALLFGIGAALTLDEFALWLRLEDVYWSKEGRWSVDATIIFAVILALILLGWSFWQDVGRELFRLAGLL